MRISVTEAKAQLTDLVRRAEAGNEVMIAEALIVAGRRGLGAAMTQLIDGLGFEIVNVTSAAARRVAGVHDAWGKAFIPPGSTSATVRLRDSEGAPLRSALCRW